MGAAPSGWLPPPYPAPIAPSGWCAVDSRAPAVNYNNQYGLYIQQLDNAAPVFEFRTLWHLASNITSTVKGLMFDWADPLWLAFSSGDPTPFNRSFRLKLEAVTTDFNPAVLTWAGLAGLTFQQLFLLDMPASLVAPAGGTSGGSIQVSSMIGSGAAGAGQSLLGATCYGFMLSATMGSAAGTIGIFSDMAYPAIGPRVSLANWRAL